MPHRGRAGLREHQPPPLLLLLLFLPPSRASPRVCPPVRARAREVAGGCARSCSLCSLTPVAAPTHCTPAPPPSDRGCSLSPVVCQCLSPALRLSPPPLSCLVSFHRSQPRSRRVEGSALPAQTAATPGRPRTNLPALLLLPHGPASLHRRRCCCCCRRRRVEGDPDPTLFLRPDKNAQKAPHDEDCSVSWSCWSAGSLLLLLLLPLLLLGDFLGFLSGSEG